MLFRRVLWLQVTLCDVMLFKHLVERASKLSGHDRVSLQLEYTFQMEI